jgi:hypothetical protein
MEYKINFSNIIAKIGIKFLVARLIIQFNSIQFFIIYVPSQQPQGQLQTEHR